MSQFFEALLLEAAFMMHSYLYVEWRNRNFEGFMSPNHTIARRIFMEPYLLDENYYTMRERNQRMMAAAERKSANG